MHQLTLLLADASVHETSKTAFYVAGGVLAAWAMVLAFLGFSRPELPKSVGAERGIMLISAVLVVAAMSTAIITASTPASAGPYNKVVNGGLPGGVAPPPTIGLPAATTSTAAAGAPAAPSVPGLVALAADPSGQLAYDKKSVSVTPKGGKVTISFTNNSQTPHNVVVAQGAKVIGQTPVFTGGKKSVTLTLPKGSYTFYCSVPGHQQAGMQGTLTVG